MMRRLRRFLSLTRSEQRLVLRARWMLGIVRISLRLFGYKRLYGWIEQRFPVSVLRPSDSKTIEQALYIGRWVNIVNQHSGGTCLHRSLVVYWLLGQHSIESTLHFGLPRQAASGFVAHVWVQVGDTIVNDRPDIRNLYAEFRSPCQFRILEQDGYHFG